MHSYLQITQSFGFCHLRVILKHTVTFYNHRIPIRASDQSVSSQGKCFRTFLPKSQTISHTIKLSSNTVYSNDTKSNCLTFPAPQMADQRFKSRFFSPALEALRLPPNCLSNSASTNPQTKLPFQLAGFLYCHLNVFISIQRYVHLPHLGVGCPGTWQEETKDTAEHPSVCRKTAHNIEGHLKRNCFNLCSLSVGSFLTYSVHLMLVHDRQLLQYLLNRTGAASGLTCRYFGKHQYLQILID